MSARQVAVLFAADGPPLEHFELFLSTGEPERNQSLVATSGSLVYRQRQRFFGNQDHRAVWTLDQPQAPPFRFVRLQLLKHTPGARLAEFEVEAIGDNLALNLAGRPGGVQVIEDEGGIDQSVAVDDAGELVDGDLITHWQGPGGRGATDIWSNVVLDLGAVYWLDWVRLVGGVVGRPFPCEWINGVGYTARCFTQREFRFGSYELRTSTGARAADGSYIWRRHFIGEPSQHNRDSGLADHPVPLHPARLVQLRWQTWDNSCNCAANVKAAEFQVFGQGFPQRAGLRSAPIDLGQDKNLRRLHWSADTPPGTRVEIRSRSGDQLEEEITFRDNNGKAITERRWTKTPKPLRGPVDTTRVIGPGWSPWSQIYSHSGDAFHSPSPRRYVQLDVQLHSQQPESAAALEWLSLEFGPALAGQVVGEVAPIDVEPGALTSIFTNATRFDAFIADNQSAGDRQRVDPGDATNQIDTNSTVVRLPVGANLLDRSALKTPVVTPNGDGVNDALVVEVDLLNVLAPRPLRLRLYNLGGRLVHRQEHQALAGRWTLTWDGRNAGGGLVPPGAYIAQIELVGDAQAPSSRRLVHVVY